MSNKLTSEEKQGTDGRTQTEQAGSDRRTQAEQAGSDRRTQAEREADRSDQHPSTGAIGGDQSDAADTPIGLPAKDSSPLGDSDQHSSAATAPGHARK